MAAPVYERQFPTPTHVVLVVCKLDRVMINEIDDDAWSPADVSLKDYSYAYEIAKINKNNRKRTIK